jgi:porin
LVLKKTNRESEQNALKIGHHGVSPVQGGWNSAKIRRTHLMQIHLHAILRPWLRGFISLVLLPFLGVPALLKAAPITVPNQQNEPNSIWNQSCLMGNCGGFRDQLSSKGIDFTVQYAAEVMGNPYGGNFGQGTVYNGLFSPVLNVNFDKLTGDAWKGASFRASGFWTHGESLTQKYVGDFSVVSNIDAYDTVRLDELWLQQNFLDGQVSLKVGQLTVDSEFFGTTNGAVFINSTFGAFPFIGQNFQPYSSPIYPVATPGVRLRLQPIPEFYFQAAAYTGDSGTEQLNNHGTLFNFDPKAGALMFYEMGYLLNQAKDETGLPGSYKVGSWVHTGDFSTWQSQAAASSGTGSLQNAGTLYGVYGVIDQAVLKYEVSPTQSTTINLFLRAGVAPSDAILVDFDIDGGVNISGLIPGRKDDVCGVGLARTAISHDYSASSVAQGGPAFGYEAVLEATYCANITPWWTVQPDIQYVFSAGATTKSPDALTIGLRTTIGF